jgi:hypothetical protein
LVAILRGPPPTNDPCHCPFGVACSATTVQRADTVVTIECQRRMEHCIDRLMRDDGIGLISTAPSIESLTRQSIYIAIRPRWTTQTLAKQGDPPILPHHASRARCHKREPCIQVALPQTGMSRASTTVLVRELCFRTLLVTFICCRSLARRGPPQAFQHIQRHALGRDRHCRQTTVFGRQTTMN